MRRALRNIGRLLRIAWTLGRWDALFLLSDYGLVPAVTFLAGMAPRKRGLGSPGRRLAGAFQALGPSFIKFGQALSTRPDLVGEEIAAELSALQDRLPPFDAKAARAIVESEFGVPLDSLFREFTDEPVAAASIAQVHFAVTAAGEPVAVKILRPGVERALERDLELFYWLAEIAERALPSWRRLRPVEVIRTFAQSVMVEMDLRFEAAAASELRQNFAEDEGFLVPAVDWRRTSRRVLTLERVEGIPIDERDALVAAGHDPHAVLGKAAGAFFNQIFRDGFFHADLHPGNLLVDAEGNVVAVDFGIMGRLDAQTRRYLAEMLLGFLIGDYERVAEVHFEAGYVPRRTSKAAFVQALRSIGEPILGRPLNEISIAQLLGQLFQITEAFEMETQPQLLLLQKTMLMAEGLTRRLTPDQNMWVFTRPLIERWARENLGVQARVRDAAEELLEAAGRLPRLAARAERAFDGLEAGVSLSPDTLEAMSGRRRGGSALPLLLAVIAALLAGLLAVQLL
ncbi:MAG: 2-polyprenylphenol 6-hydroxylase [Rhodospirillales bacterium]|nr:2-polyprenylphenol 6-hydroxylase [Rhodospirillales bacterium]MDE0382146.1 2-polyprenylphenol 6-hydroxylase [Rhodospirillales bacterium]